MVQEIFMTITKEIPMKTQSKILLFTLLTSLSLSALASRHSISVPEIKLRFEKLNSSADLEEISVQVVASCTIGTTNWFSWDQHGPTTSTKSCKIKGDLPKVTRDALGNVFISAADFSTSKKKAYLAYKIFINGGLAFYATPNMKDLPEQLEKLSHPFYALALENDLGLRLRAEAQILGQNRDITKLYDQTLRPKLYVSSARVNPNVDLSWIQPSHDSRYSAITSCSPLVDKELTMVTQHDQNAIRVQSRCPSLYLTQNPHRDGIRFKITSFASILGETVEATHSEHFTDLENISFADRPVTLKFLVSER